MKKLNYKVELLSDWHIGSGLDSATDTNALVLKNELHQPYIPGKTIKGLFKDAMYDMVDAGKIEEEVVIQIFGEMTGKQESVNGAAFFCNAALKEPESEEIYSNSLSDFLYRNLASTAISENGSALESSLRVTQVTLPIDLYGQITGLDDVGYDAIRKALKLIRHLGVSRNRGLGRCKFINLEN